MKKAFAYLRVSGKGQVEGDGFERQLLAIESYAAKNGMEIVQVFREEGVSGTTDWDDREAFTEMMALLMSNGTRTVLVENLSRLARDLMIQESIISDFKRKGLELVSVAEPDIMAADDPSRVFIRQVLGAFHQYEKSLLVAKLKGARIRTKAKIGVCEGRKAYGFRANEKPVIERIVKLRREGLPLEAIATSLNTVGIDGTPVPTRAEKQWSAVQVNRVLARASEMKISPQDK
jgi:DNA invertase Pin-like site-specific DNA recombinase